MKHTVGQLLKALEGVDPNTTVLVHDTRSGVVDFASFGVGEFQEGDDDYGVSTYDVAIGEQTFNIYLG